MYEMPGVFVVHSEELLRAVEERGSWNWIRRGESFGIGCDVSTRGRNREVSVRKSMPAN
jgi:hypothetical protein